VKFTGNLYSYVCERPPLKYIQTRVCGNSYTRTRTVPDLYSCLCEHSLSQLSASCKLPILSHDEAVIYGMLQMFSLH